jgi:tripartite-type tricarboxylate transporter receptor subunit TctC
MQLAVSAALGALIFFASGGAHAQQYPAKPVRLVMPYPAGGSTDTVGRLVAERLTASLGEQVLVDNRPGASAQIGTEAVAKAPPDGYTLLMATSTNVINRAINPKLPYDFPRDFAPVALVAKAAQLLVIHPSIPARSVREFIAFAKTRPGQLSYSSSGTGTSGHLAMEAFAREAKLSMVHVPYKGNAPALNDLLGGHVAAGFVNVVSVVPHIRAKRLTALAVSSAQRSALARDVPTLAELGYPGFDVTAWFGIMAPAGTPAAIVARLNQEIVAILRTPQVEERLLGFGVDRARIESPKAFADFLQEDIARWTKLTKEIGLKAE